MNFTHTVKFTVADIHCDRFKRCKVSSLLRFSQDAAESHCLLLGTDWNTMASKGLFWAVIRQRIEISRLPQSGEHITVTTWPMPTTRVAYPRATAGYDEAGNELFKVISLWVIMDRESRAMIRPDKSGVEVQGTTFGTELPAPGGLNFKDLENTAIRSVGFTELDVNGHMNNTRYLDWLCDLLPSFFHKDHPLKAVTVCYLSEALEGQQVHLKWEYFPSVEADSISARGGIWNAPLQEGALAVEGSVAQTDANPGHTKIFTAKAEF